MRYLCILLTNVMFILNCSTQTSCSIYDYFNLGNLNNIQVEYYDSMHTASLDTIINCSNLETVNHIKNLLKMLPAAGEIMVNIAECPVTKLILMMDSNEKASLTFFGESLCSPEGTFYDQPTKDEMSELFNLIIGIKPEWNSPL